MLSALVEEAVTVGDVVRLLSLQHGQANIVELTLADDTPFIGRRVGDVPWPEDVALVAIVRDTRVLVPSKDDPLEAGDELLFVATDEVEGQLDTLLSGRG
jgi:trk system potassium uptake protein TrkA